MGNGRGGLIAYLIRRVIPQALVLVLLGSLIGIYLNARAVDTLTLDLPGTILLSESGAATVLTGRAAEIYEEGEYIFVDARLEAIFSANHIEGALCLPYEKFDELYPLLADWTGGQPVLVYGSLAEAQIADDLARRLINSGETEVYLFVGGFESWVEAGLPVAEGEDGLLLEDDWGDEDNWDDPDTGGDD